MQAKPPLDSSNLRGSGCTTFGYAFDCPSGMLRNQWLGIRGSALKGRQIVFITDIAQGDANVAQKSTAFDSFDWRITEEDPKFFLT